MYPVEINNVDMKENITPNEKLSPITCLCKQIEVSVPLKRITPTPGCCCSATSHLYQDIAHTCSGESHPIQEMDNH